MPLAIVVLAALAVFAVGYLVYSRVVAKVYALDDTRTTPAVSRADGVDYVPTRAPMLLAQHFAAISAAGPVVGPILACAWFGWVPALLWVVLGAVVIGAVHDFSTLVASVRHRACSLPEVVREHIGRPAYWVFVGFIWLSLMYVLVAFIDITARQFVVPSFPGAPGVAAGPAVATSSMLYLGLAVVMGLLLEKAKLRASLVTTLCVPLLLVAVWAGQWAPLSLPASWGGARAWAALILGYCFVASVLPMWVLLQPRGTLGGFFLYVILIAGLLGILVGGEQVNYPAFVGFTSPTGLSLVPFLFVTIACGACSGFHGLVASGTTSKQVAEEGHCRPVGYGGMLLEGVIAVVSLATVMVMTQGSSPGDPSLAFAAGLARFVSALGIDPGFALGFGMLAFATFVFDTVDVATRMGRYLLEELLGWQGGGRRWLSTALTLAIPALYLVLMPESRSADGKVIPAYMVIWTVFGAANQLLAGLSLCAVAVWLMQEGRSARFVLLPMVIMLGVTLWALGAMAMSFVRPLLAGRLELGIQGINGLVAVGLIGLAVAFLRMAWAARSEERRIVQKQA